MNSFFAESLLRIFLIWLVSCARAAAPQAPVSAASYSGCNLGSDVQCYPVCIIGAGPSGLTVASELESRKISTVIFDSNLEVGGKCQSYYDDPARTKYHPMGAITFTNQTYNNTLPLILEAGLPLSPAPSPGPSANWLYWLYGPGIEGAQNVTEAPLPDEAELISIQLEVEQYTLLWNTQFAPNYTGSRTVFPKTLAVPMSEWLSANGFELIPLFVEEGLVYYGYGDFTQTPALFALQLLTPEILTYIIGITPGYSVDFHKLWVWFSETHVKGTIYSSTNVTQIDRSGEYPVVTYNTKGNEAHTQTCSRLVLAFPPTLRALTAAGLDFTPQERKVFLNVGVEAYCPPVPDSGPIALLRYFNDSPISTTWSFGPSPYNETSSDTDEQVMELLVQTANSLGVGIAHNEVGNITTPISVTEGDVKLFTRQDYFPHALTNALNAGFYESYNALQGQKNTYWTSGLNRFEDIESVIISAKDLVDNVIC
ncbi:hypothetical protein BT96DRAFT_1006704 [Gymnopus androsaceus JB14]|uniref:FAD/NAD(P)-binding domain-containing protein n=1 Tax=Gymnopus androsaceus JB14 TaxID=1447944 RepID=A0A6A4GKK4_9AGAR|nr:hypothetical protein BT96DRAFT_1006704 [Gymnopus androsaceus JB14]